MLRKVLWITLACAVLLAALAISRGLKPAADEPQRAEAPVMRVEAAEDVPRPVAKAPPPPQPVAPPQAVPEDLQVQEDAAAVGLTTLDPEPQPEETESPPF